MSDIIGRIDWSPGFDKETPFTYERYLEFMRDVLAPEREEILITTITDQIRRLRPGQKLTIERREKNLPSDPSFTVVFTDVIDGSPE